MENPASSIAADSQRDIAEAAKVKAPILWALLALAYLFEIGAIAVIINTETGALGNLKMWAGIFAMAFPLATMAGIIVMRVRWEKLFYVSHEYERGVINQRGFKP